MKVIYHAHCVDGWAAAWILATTYDYDLTESDLIAASYGDPIPYDRLGKDEQVFIVDFSYSRVELILLTDRVGKITVLDHHKTAQAELEGLVGTNLHIEFDMDRSGAMMAWDYCINNDVCDPIRIRRIKWVAEYVQDRDLWKWELPVSKEISEYFGSLPKTLEAWDSMKSVSGAEEFGAVLLAKKNQEVKAAVAQSYFAMVEGFRVPCFNAGTNAPISEALNELAVGHPFAVCWTRMPNGRYRWAFRSEDIGCEVGNLCAHMKKEGRSFTGGGHARAAGAELDHEPIWTVDTSK